jgi:curli biogenesis system outer membrane secretion channel CsgG
MKKFITIFGVCLLLANCATKQPTVIQVAPQVKEAQADSQTEQRFLKRKVAVSRFSNETQYAKGLFYDKENDPIGKQAVDILSTKLASSNKFILLERQDGDKIDEEIKLAGNTAFQKIGADYLIIGSVTEFGRKNTGDTQVFSRSKTQIVEAGVSLRLVDVSTGQIIYSEEAKGEAETTNKTVLGLGEKADYDATLSDKAISAAISKLVENVINNCMDRPWKSYFLSVDANGIIISGGKSQGLRVGDTYLVVKKGASVKNPQTGMLMELPGQNAGKIKIDFIGGTTEQDEFSVVSFTEGSIDKTKVADYYISEVK